MSFIRNTWYVAAWDHEVAAGAVIGRVIAGEPVALYRLADGTPAALADRCPHRHAPLSAGRVEGEGLRCLYHGLRFGRDGTCLAVPGSDTIPPNSTARAFPLVERHSWLWIWLGDPALADPALIPIAFGLGNPDWVMRDGVLDYAADYQLINDNLTDLSHLDFTHETTLGAATGTRWSDSQPRITALGHGLRFERWFTDRLLRPGRADRCDTMSMYHYWLPGIFVMETRMFPPGAAAACDFGTPNAVPILRRVEQQAVTPIAAGHSRYLYATGVEAANTDPMLIEAIFAIVNAAFAEDKAMIEGQQRIWNRTPADVPHAFIPQDKGPALFRRLIARRLAAEAGAGADVKVATAVA